MTKSKKIALLIASVVILALLIVAAVTDGAMATVACPDCNAETAADCETCGGEAVVRGSVWALLPPVIAIGLALITKEVYRVDCQASATPKNASKGDFQPKQFLGLKLIDKTIFCKVSLSKE